MVLRSSRNRLHQSRLSFTPLPSSSPQSQDYPEQIRERAAAVRYEPSPSSYRKRKLLDVSPRESASMATPTKHRSSKSALELSPSARAQTRTSGLPSPLPSSEPKFFNRHKKSFRTSLVIDSSSSSENEAEEDEDDDLQITSSRRKPRQTMPAQERPEDDPLPVTPQKRRRPVVRMSDEEDDDVVVQFSRRRRSQISEAAEDPEDDLYDDLEYLESSNIRKSRTRGNAPVSAKKSAAQRQLDLLKRRRAGEKIEQPESSSNVTKAGSKRALYDTDSNEAEGDEYDDELSEPAPYSGPPDPDEDDEDFVIQDEDNAAIGAPSEYGLADIPIEFTRHAHKKLREHFRDAVEWMVHNKLDPGFPRDDPVYRTAFMRLDDEVKGYSASKFTSSAWKRDFTVALQARPLLYVEELGSASLDQKCQACGRSNHPSKFILEFSGKPYVKRTLEEVSDDEDEENSGKSYDSMGREIPDLGIKWALGRTCKANAETAHSLEHWRYHLNQWVIDFLKNEQHLTAEKLLERESWNAKKKGKYADGVVDEMEDNGEIKSLFRDFKNNLESARTAKNDRYYRA